jgi:uncharacterized membrane-anchored protein
MAKTTSKADFSLLKKPSTKEDFFIWSYIVSLASVLLSAWLDTNTLPGGRDLVKPLLSALVPAIFLFLYWVFIRWVATTAEKAGRSFVAFMIFAILAPVIAWIVVIMFKKPEPIEPNA